MSKINLVLADTDKEYREALCDYILEKESDRFQITSFSNKDMLINHIENNKGNINILLASGEMLDDNLIDKVKSYAILVDDDNCRNHDKDRYIYKYQRAEKIINNLLSINSTVSNNGIKNAQVISIFSLDEKNNKAMEISTLLAGGKNRVLFISLNALIQRDMYDKAISKGLSNIIYELKANKNIERISNYISKDIEKEIDYIEPFQNFLEYYEMNEEDIKMIIEKLLSLGGYEYLIIELASDFGDTTKTAMQLSNKIIVTYNQEFKKSMLKFKRDIESDIKNHEILSNMIFVDSKTEISDILIKADE